MYLKKYDLSEKQLTNEKCKEMFIAVFGKRDNYVIERAKGSIRIHGDIVCNKCEDMVIWDFGSIYIDSPLHAHMLPASVFGMLLESQWINPKVELPKQECEVIIKTDMGITKADFGKEEGLFYAYNYDAIFDNENKFSGLAGWLPNDNVVI